jgi:transcription elongation GreA/GreB family factor
MPRSKASVDRPGERQGRPQLTSEGYARLQDRVADIRQRRLPERVVAEFERLLEEADATDSLLGSADVIVIDPVAVDGRVELGMRVRVILQEGGEAWVRPVHPNEAFLDDERISATSPLAIAIVGARAGHTVWVDAPTGAWPCEIREIDLQGVALEA